MNKFMNGILLLGTGAILGGGAVFYMANAQNNAGIEPVSPAVEDIQAPVAEMAQPVMSPDMPAAPAMPEMGGAMDMAPVSNPVAVDAPEAGPIMGAPASVEEGMMIEVPEVAAEAADPVVPESIEAPMMDGPLVSLNNAYIFETSENARAAAAFVEIANMSAQNDRLIGASYEFAERTELHTMEDDGDVMRMRKVDGFDIPSAVVVRLEPKGNHIMLVGLEKPLNADDVPVITLSFEKSGDITLDFPVVSRGDDMPEANEATSGAAQGAAEEAGDDMMHDRGEHHHHGE